MGIEGDFYMKKNKWFNNKPWKRVLLVVFFPIYAVPLFLLALVTYVVLSCIEESWDYIKNP